MHWSDNIILPTAEKKHIKKAKKEAKIKLEYRTWAVRVRVRYRSPYTIAEILKNLLIIISDHMA